MAVSLARPITRAWLLFDRSTIMNFAILGVYMIDNYLRNSEMELVFWR